MLVARWFGGEVTGYHLVLVLTIMINSFKVSYYGLVPVCTRTVKYDTQKRNLCTIINVNFASLFRFASVLFAYVSRRFAYVLGGFASVLYIASQTIYNSFC